ncbi:hypothetical protein NCC78_16205 [Micromonospora phytophila]|uniref:hypothetical protein n=1 Tax=Micromonospora phytophila TaxID=709888 RepID=UPI00202F7D88|nr:hypothetical protein [Micromonospora phytophila]MCM0676221.1 hypothetical protein [Micromonospora phytophila]
MLAPVKCGKSVPGVAQVVKVQMRLPNPRRAATSRVPTLWACHLTARMGHDSSQAALIYQHVTAEADRAIAQALHEATRADRKKAKQSADGSGKAKDTTGKKAGGKRGKKRSANRDEAGDDRA